MEKLKNILTRDRSLSSSKESKDSKESKPTPSRRSQFGNWAVAFIVCNFNVDVGPEVELVYPPETHFSTSDLQAISFHSFPERQDSEPTEDIAFHFTIRNNSPEIILNSPCPPYGSGSKFYGTCIFRQQFDGTMKRSFNQRSLVLLSNQNFPAFFTQILHQMASSGVINNDPVPLEAAYNQIAAWPPPSIGRHDLPFLGTVRTIDIAPHVAFPLQGLSTLTSAYELSGRPIPICAYQPVSSWNTLARSLPYLSELYVIFEKVILCENVLVLAKSPQVCSDFVSAMVDLIRPIPYAGDCRPYLTMQSEFGLNGIEGSTPRHFLVGSTNPFLQKRISSTAENGESTTPYVVYLDETDDKVPIKRHHSLSARAKANFSPGSGESQSAPTRYLKSDHSFTKTLDQMLKKGPSATDEIGPLVRRHFSELAAQFLAPLNRFLASQTTRDTAAPGRHPQYANFSEAAFIQSLSKYGTSLKFRGDPIQKYKARDSFYEQFCRSPNFYSWLDMKLSLEREASAGLLNAPETGAIQR
ncbi:hypothetical protein M501DRAFT_942545 [Patellaria atrata CBS 101060]|uniref:UDENN domain-containing protein n=1 Tax=Patellaria atrata CBS 101060 TaxID=1346257 RepID=A0A9P4S2L8_9PEZI|nr:hypothetical protein M501DRAFT_942545 [Patellaria atrata CBS 101060]